MANTQLAFISKHLIPERAALQASIDALGFDLQLDPDYTPFEDSGFSPCQINGKAGFGFEIYYASSQEAIGHDTSLLAMADGRDHCISMVWHSSMNDLACAMIVSCALTKDFNAIVSYEGEPPTSLEEMLGAANEAIQLGAAEHPPTAQQQTPGTRSQKPWWKLW